MEQLEAETYDVPHWDCPACGEVNDGFGHDSLSGDIDCIGCKATVRINYLGE